jgi:hypothetical protein
MSNAEWRMKKGDLTTGDGFFIHRSAFDILHFGVPPPKARFARVAG